MRPVPFASRSALSFALSSPVITASPALIVSLHVIETMRMTGAGSTASCATTLIVTLTSFLSGGQSVAGDALTDVITGAERSATVIVNAPEAVLLLASVAVQVTVVVAIGKSDPDGGVQKTGTLPSTASKAVATNVATEPPGPAASRRRSFGSVTTGGVVSGTVILTTKLPSARLPCVSVAEQWTVVDPAGKVDPDGGVQTTLTEPSTRSDALAL